MRRGRWNQSARWITVCVVTALLLSACGEDRTVLERGGGVAAASAEPAGEVSSNTLATTTTTAAPTTTTASITTTTAAPSHEVAATGFAPFAAIGELMLVHPAAHIERLGFHESNHDGARQMEPAATAVQAMTLESRERGTGSRTAADIVVPPDEAVFAPVTGTVLRAGGYILYCEHDDDFAVIEPDARPGWEVKLLHIDGVQVSAGDRVEAGVTLIAPRATQLPFESQVDEFTGEPSWPHVHLEVVDPSIPDRPSPGGGGGCP